MSLFVAVPVKPFGVAKARLAGELTPTQRSLLGKAIAHHTVTEALRTGARVAVVTGSADVARWADNIGAEVVDEPEPGLDAAARAAAARAVQLGAAWLILHADLPLVTTADLEAAIGRRRPGHIVISPSHDGGTSLLMGSHEFPFSYGPASFHRHLAAAGGRADVIVRTGLALDLDTPADLAAAYRLGMSGTWHEVPA